jgi:hypothetical protein
MRTKWEILEARIAAAKKELEQLEAQKNWLMTVRFDAECTHCGQELETEADFAKHFLIPDERLINTGHCRTAIQVLGENLTKRYKMTT